MKQFYQIFKIQFRTVNVIICLLLFSNVKNGRAQTTLFSENFESAGSVSCPTSSSGYKTIDGGDILLLVEQPPGIFGMVTEEGVYFLEIGRQW